jgi:hypothetical protein
MVKLAVTPSEVRKMAGRLRRLQEAFEDLDDDAHRHASVAVAGDERVATRLREFACNWHDRRLEVARRMAELAGHADGAASAYQEIDRTVGPR